MYACVHIKPGTDAVLSYSSVLYGSQGTHAHTAEFVILSD